MIKPVWSILVLLFIIISYENSFAGWIGPVSIVEGQWGVADNEFGIEHGDSFDNYPSLDGVLGGEKIVISDIVNKRTVVYGIDGTFIEKEEWVKHPAESGMIRYSHSKYLLGCCVQGYDIEGNLWTGGRNKYALTNKDGQLLKTTTERPLELGRVNERSLGGGRYKVTITYPEKTYTLTKGPYEKYIRDNTGYIHAISGKGVEKFNTCGKVIGELIIPENERRVIRPAGGGFEEISEVIKEYGQPVVAPNGDVYTWKRTPDNYSILKWTWQDEPNPTADLPDAPTGLTASGSSNGITLRWKASLQDPGCVSEYEIGRAAVSGGAVSTIGTVDKGIYTYEDTTAEAGTTYYYKVRSKGGEGYSEYSNEASGKRQ